MAADDLVPLAETPATSTSTDMLQPIPRANDEIGITLDMPFGTYNDEVYNPAEIDVPDLLSRIQVMLRTDGHFKALFRLLSLPFRQAKWSIVPDDDGDEEADFLEQMLTRPPYQGGMTTSFDFIRAGASRAFAHGFQVWEEVYGYADMPGHGNMLVLRKLAARESRTIRFNADDHGGFDGVTQRASDSKGGMRTIRIPRDKVFFFTVDKEEHPFYGRSMFEPALYHFDKKHKLYYIAHIAAQITAVPGRVATQETGGAQELKGDKLRQLQSALANFGFNSAMVLPNGVKLEPFGQGTTSGLEGILNLINHHNIQASQSILAQFIDLGQQSGGGGGSFALSKDSSDLFLMASQALLDSWAEHLNWHLFPKFIDWNFGTGKYPRIQFEPLADETKAAMLEVFKVLATAATTQVTPDFIWELEKRVSDMLGIEVDYDTLEAEKAELEDQADVVRSALETLTGEGLGVDPTLDPAGPPAADEPGLVPASEMGLDLFLTEDFYAIELATPGVDERPVPGKPKSQSASAKEKEASRQRRQQEKGKRDKLGMFSKVNEVGSGGGMGGQSSLAPVVTDIQTRLKQLGYDLGDFGDGGVDGKFGPVTAKAVAKYQEDNGLPVTGRVDMGTYALLLEAAPKEGATKKAATPKKKAVSDKQAAARAKAAKGPPPAAKNVAEVAARLRAAKAAKGSKGVSEE